MEKRRVQENIYQIYIYIFLKWDVKMFSWKVILHFSNLQNNGRWKIMNRIQRDLFGAFLKLLLPLFRDFLSKRLFCNITWKEIYENCSIFKIICISKFINYVSLNVKKVLKLLFYKHSMFITKTMPNYMSAINVVFKKK